jgi:hypothetical protein
MFAIITQAQFTEPDTTSKAQLPLDLSRIEPSKKDKSEVKLSPVKWKLTRNHIVTGGLMFLAGAAKGFNETLQFNYKGFSNVFPHASKFWFDPQFSFKNKYKDHDPAKGAAFPLSTSVLVMLTDQFHLNNFIHRATMTAALVIKIGEGKRPFKNYVYDVLYYTAAYQAGFGSIYYPFKARNPQ